MYNGLRAVSRAKHKTRDAQVDGMSKSRHVYNNNIIAQMYYNNTILCIHVGRHATSFYVLITAR